MEAIVKSMSEKISSYNIFNNLFPGVVFCSILTKTTRFCFTTENILEQLFIWYFIGMIISRIGSVFVEGLLKKLKFRGRQYIVFADYKLYVAASEKKPFIATLSESNNTYRTMIALLLSIGFVDLYDMFVFEWIAEKCIIGNKIICIITGVFLVALFVKSYKKQTNYITKQVEKYISEQKEEK